jgi:hypothetical protein
LPDYTDEQKLPNSSLHENEAEREGFSAEESGNRG